MRPLEDESRRIIAEGDAADGPPPEAEARIWQELAARLSEPLPPTAAAASEALTSTWKVGLLSSLGGKLVIGLAALGISSAIGLGWYATTGVPPQSAALPAPAQAARAIPASASPQLHTRAALPAAEPSGLAEETRLLAAAQRALNAAQPGKALPLLAQHRQRFPRGELAQERDAAHALALCAIGRNAQARGAVRQFLREWPNSPLSARIRAGCRLSIEE